MPPILYGPIAEPLVSLTKIYLCQFEFRSPLIIASKIFTQELPRHNFRQERWHSISNLSELPSNGTIESIRIGKRLQSRTLPHRQCSCLIRVEMGTSTSG